MKQHLKNLKVTFFFTSCLILLLAGSGLYLTIKSRDSFTLTNPLLKYTKFKELKPFRYKVDALIQEQKDKGLVRKVSVYFRSLSDGIWFGIDERDNFCPASLMKVPIMIAYLKAAEKDPGVLSKKLKYDVIPDSLSQNIKPDMDIKKGDYASIDVLINRMIAYSDNNALGILVSNIDKNILDQTLEDLGLVYKEVSPKDDFVSLKSYVSVFRVLYNASYLNKEMSEKALKYLTNCKYKNGMVADLPPDIIAAHKVGERNFEEAALGQGEAKELHEVGIIYHHDNPYLLGIMTKGNDFYNLNTIIKEISALIYNEVDSQYKETSQTKFELNE